jgi:F-type H+-transporting ATPase subunit c
MTIEKGWMFMNFRKALFLVSALSLVGASAAMAQEHAAVAADSGKALASALAIAIAAFGGAIGQGMTAKAALEGIARNPAAQPKIFVPMIIGLALIESLVIYALIIALR